jgi:hypothetical protein
VPDREGGRRSLQAGPERLGEEGTVELAAIVRYYTMLAVFMNACEAC